MNRGALAEMSKSAKDTGDFSKSYKKSGDMECLHRTLKKNLLSS